MTLSAPKATSSTLPAATPAPIASTASTAIQPTVSTSPSVTEMVGRLAAEGLVEHESYRGQRLTTRGHKVALELVRHHRLLEMFLVRTLGYSWDEVHEEAERLEHVISERLEERIF